MRQLIVVIAAAFLAVGVASRPSSSLSPPVQVALQASWNAPPLVLEVLEFVHRVQEPSRMFQAIDRLLQVDAEFAQRSPAQLHARVVEENALGLDEARLQLLRASLAMHVHAPAIEAAYEYYRERQDGERMRLEVAPSCAVHGDAVWMEWQGRKLCNADEWKSAGTGAVEEVTSAADLHPAIDHVRKNVASDASSIPNSPETAIVYADVLSPRFATFHRVLSAAADAGAITYILRWKPSPSSETTVPLYLNGYGVELMLKSTEYKVTDDQKIVQDGSGNAEADGDTQRNTVGTDVSTDTTADTLFGFDFRELAARYPSANVSNFRATLLAEMDSTAAPRIPPVQPGEMANIGERFASFITASPFPLHTMRRFVEDFPKFHRFLATRPIDQDVAAEMRANQRDRVQAGAEVLWMNGMEVDLEKFNVFALLSVLPFEVTAVESLSALGATPAAAVEIIAGAQGITDGRDAPTIDGFYNVHDSGELAASVTWWNDIERDSRYRTWNKNMMELLSVQPGSALPRIKWNLLNAVLVADLARPSDRLAIRKTLELIKSEAPIRFGLVLKSTRQNALARSIFMHLEAVYGKKSCAEFVEKLGEGDIDPLVVTAAYNAVIASNTPKKPEMVIENVDDIPSNEAVTTRVAAADTFVQRFGLQGEDSAGAIFVNGKYFELTEDFEDSLMHGSQITVSMLQRWLYYGQISGNENIYRHILSQTIFRPRRNPYFVLSETNPLRVIDSVAYGKDVAGVKHIDHSDETVVTVWLVGDMNNKNVAATAAEAVAFVEKTPRARLAVFHVGTDRFEVDTDTDWSAVVRQSDDIPTSVKSLFSSTGYTIVANGRVIGPIQESFKMVMSDYQQLFDAELSRFKGLPVLLSDIKRTPDVTLADAHAIAASTLLSLAVRHTQSGELVELGTRAETIKRSTAYHGIRAEHASFEEGDRSAPVHIVAILDPLSKMTQRVAPILDELSRMRKIFHVKIIFNPTAAVDADDLPLKRFYRYAIATELRFNGRGQMRKPKVVFEGVPVEPLLTLGMDVIQPWVVAPKVSPYDLDNIRLSDLSGNAAESVRGISADFLLQHILVEGHCRDKRTHSPPSGLQFELMAAGSGDDEQRSTSNGTVHQDTIVMANLGYYQLKTNPGVWQMMMRKGRSRELYDFVDVVSGGTTIPSRDGVRVDVAVTSFSGALLYTRVKKRAGKEKEDLLMDDDNVTSNKPAEANTGGMLENLLGWAGVKSDDDKAAVVNPDSIRHADINIFSVASGHLYERFLRIMIVSVLKHTKSTVKFWFIENFLSPSFKDFLPFMAKRHNFRFELVTYKWPQWLRAQSEKQRTIWGYKILFLDVLFPLDLHKVIFVDADQIVRTDLLELVNMDLKGAPYGYTPFCESRKDIEGFRFWKHGYWKEHLNGKPYHISALYVVDLKRFRQLAAGDQLRQQYQSLSADPHSLSNLDQDLPNNMQHQVPIYSLPQDWLWCETWCDDGSLMAARTIDLCNNPQTKEAKLDRARRLLPEWTAYDEQTRMLFDEWKRGEGVTTLTRSSTVMPSVSVTVTTETAESSTLPAHDEL